MHAPFLGLKVNSVSGCLQQEFAGKAQGQSTFSNSGSEHILEQLLGTTHFPGKQWAAGIASAGSAGKLFREPLLQKVL
jgi:hypothetical protein